MLSNILLTPLDQEMRRKGYQLTRYADDWVVTCASAAEARAAVAAALRILNELGVQLHPQKTRICDTRQPGQGFDFLGYRFESGLRFVRKKSLKAFKDKVRARTKRSRGVSMGRIVAELNPMLRGWFGYFKHAVPSEFKLLDSFIRRRLRAILRKQEKRPAFGRCPNDHRRWPNAYFASLGLFTLSTARYQARHSR